MRDSHLADNATVIIHSSPTTHVSKIFSLKVFSSHNEFTLRTVQTEETALMNKTNSDKNVVEAL